MIVDKLKEIAEGFDWTFEYGPDDWQNLGDYELDDNKPFNERKKYFLLLWKDTDPKLNSFGATDGITYEGEIVLMVRSKMSDPSYEYKYETHIKNLEALSRQAREELLGCNDGWMVTKWKETEVTNVYDTNMDGLKIRFVVYHAE